MIWLLWLLLLPAFLMFVWWYLHRDPDRVAPVSDSYVSPADGDVVAVIPVTGKRVRVKKGWGGITALLTKDSEAKVMIVIMMNVWHVHVQRAPHDGVITSVTRRDGSFKNAVNALAHTATVENEHVAITSKGKRWWKVYLVAGLAARRVVPLVSVNDEVVRGQRIGRINFGSQVVLVLPECEVLIKVGDKVKANLTEVAR